MKKLMLICLLVILVTGCAVKPQRVIVKETEYAYVPISDNLLKECHVTKPPSKKEYLEAGDTEQENMLRSTIVSLYGDLNNCNKQIKSIDEFNTKSKKQVEEKNKK